jgi:hypothetical protein
MTVSDLFFFAPNPICKNSEVVTEFVLRVLDACEIFGNRNLAYLVLIFGMAHCEKANEDREERIMKKSGLEEI